MVAIAIMGILASLLLGAAAVASEVARNARSKSLIARLHTLLIERYDGYRNHRVEVQPFTDNAAYRASLSAAAGFVYPTGPNSLKPPLPGSPGDPRVGAYARLAGLRETMKLELPDRWSDILNGPVPSTPVRIPPSTGRSGVVVQKVPALFETYARAYNRMVDAGVSQGTIVANESAECLYLIIMNATGDGESRGMFKPNDIGDTDEDGAFEFIDGWGKPIAFLRWAPGFNSDAQMSMASLRRVQTKSGDAAVVDAILADHDPLDLFRLDNPTTAALRGWRILPLVVSGGGDEEIGAFFGPLNSVSTLDPYADFGGGNYLGQAADLDLAADDITNHNVGDLSRK